MKYPIQVGYAFKAGDRFNPTIEGIPTQTTVKCRWPDGSVKHAIFCFYLDGDPATVDSLNFVEGSPLIGTSAPFAVDLAIELTGVQVKPTDLFPATWFNGPIASSIIYVDHSGGHDLQSSTPQKLRPSFEITYWPAINNAFIRMTLDNCQASAAGEAWIKLRFLANGAEIYSTLPLPQADQMMSYASRITKSFWLSGTPPQAQTIKYNLPYLTASGAIPNYDASVQIAESTIQQAYSTWQASAHDPFQAGLWMKAMPTTGGRPDIGPFTKWAVDWLCSGDKRHREIALGQADLACQWPRHWREDDGSMFSITDHPACTLQSLPTDGITKVSDLDNWGWDSDVAHAPQHYYLTYLLTGEFFQFEQLSFWAHYDAAYPNGGGISQNYGRGPTGAEGGMPGMPSGQIRMQAWALRSRAEAAWICPDDMPAKEYLTRLTNDWIAQEEGARNIHGTQFDGNQNWIWGNTFKHDVPPLHMWQTGNGAFVQGPFIPGVATALSMWEQNFMLYTLGRMKQLGFASDALLAWLGNNIVNQEATLQFWMGQNRIATSDTSGPFTTWAQVLGAYDPTFDVMADWNNRLQDLEHGWPIIALCAMAVLGPRPDWAEAEYQKVPWSNNPKWAITPRD